MTCMFFSFDAKSNCSSNRKMVVSYSVSGKLQLRLPPFRGIEAAVWQ